MLKKEAIRELLIHDKAFAKRFCRIIGKIRIIQSMQTRSMHATASPETIMICRESAIAMLNRVIPEIIRLNSDYERKIMGYVKDLNKLQTKWSLTDELYIIAVEFMDDAETADAIEKAFAA